MLTSYGAISPVRLNKRFLPTLSHGVAQTNTNPHYDCATFSTAPEGKSSFHMSLVGRLSQEVRTVTTTGDIQELRQSVATGEYTADPMAIAGKILFLSEE